jgi:hypothetical protein
MIELFQYYTLYCELFVLENLDLTYEREDELAFYSPTPTPSTCYWQIRLVGLLLVAESHVELSCVAHPSAGAIRTGSNS